MAVTIKANNDGMSGSFLINGTQAFSASQDGTLTAANFNSLSDASKKSNVTEINNATDTVTQITGVEFNWKDTGEKSAGVIAQDLEKVLPHLVVSNDGLLTVNYSGLIGYLIQTIKELNQRLSDLENKQ